MKPLDPLGVRARGQASEWDERVIRQRYYFSMMVQKQSPIGFFIVLSNWYEKRWFHVDSTMQAEDVRKSVVHDAGESGMFGVFDLFVVHYGADVSGWFVEKSLQCGLMMR